uniref:Uncharacterized protein n=1 Tax=Coccidioides posadasii TaxID=199306 RepID=A7KPA6_COCPO|nr:unknown [Coccidioides posadasii]
MSELAEVHCAWTESDRGQVGGDGIAIRKCSTEFLSALYKAYQKLATGSLEASVADRLNKSIAQELYRLHLYPTLYPTPEIQSRFRRLLVGGLENYLDEKQKASDDTRLDQNNIIARETDRILDSVNYPSYKPELLPWEQFLLRGSPGSGATFLTSPPNVVLRLMPMGGVALHMNWLQTSLPFRMTISYVALLHLLRARILALNRYLRQDFVIGSNGLFSLPTLSLSDMSPKGETLMLQKNLKASVK